MASGTITGSTGNQYINAKIIWSSTADRNGNTSDVTASLWYKRTNNYTTYGTGDFSITINGIKTSESNYISFSDDEWVKAMEVTVAVEHNSDGSKSVNISATGGITGTSLSSTSVKGTAVLDTIPRASTITSASAVTLGNECSVKWTPLSKSFRYKLKFSLGNWSYTTGAIHPNQTAAYIYTEYVLPLTVANQLPRAKTGDMTVTLYTYSNSAATTQVGSASSETFTVTVPSNNSTKPTLTMTLSAVNSLGDAFAGVYIKGRSKVQAKFTGEGKYGATITSYKLYVSGDTYDSPYLSDYLSKAGTITVKGRVIDSRGYYSDIEQEITVLSYSTPKIVPDTDETSIVCTRCYADGTIAEDGTYLRIRARRSYSKLTSDGVQKNFCTIRYRYRAESTNTYSDWVTLLAKSDTDDNTVDSGALAGVVSSIETTYYVQVGVIDDIGESDAVQFTVPTDFITIDCPEEFYGRRLGIFRHVSDTTEDGLYVGLPIFGGMIDSLRLGTRLTATAEAPITLADTLTPGCYYSPNATNSEYITDSPYKEGGFGLEVRELQHKDYIRQTMYYGRTTIWRHYNGTEWSDWVRVMVSTEFDSAATDFVIEHGTSDGWTYKKWKGGSFEMFGLFEVAATSSDLNGTLYRTNAIQVKTPFSIKSDTVVTGTATGHYWFTNGVYANSNAISIRIMSDKTISLTGTITVRLHVVGSYA